MSTNDPSGGVSIVVADPGSQAPARALPAKVVDNDKLAKTKPERVVPADAIIPDRGWPKIRYAVNSFFRRPDLVPAINAEQRAELHHKARTAYEQALVGRLIHLASLGVQPVICVANVKSSGKSSTALGMGTVIAEYTRKMTILIPSTANTATVTVGRMAGITGNMLPIDEYLTHVRMYGTFRTLERRLPRTKWGLGVIVESNNSSANDADDALIVPYMEAIDVTLPNVSALILDLGNDNISRRSIATQAARLSNVLVLPFMEDAPVTHVSLKDTIKFYNTDDGIPEDVWHELYSNFRNKEATGITVPTREKVNRSILVATKAGGKVDFDHFARSSDQGVNSADLKPWNGTGICVPSDASIGRKDAAGELMPFDFDAIGQETKISYLELAVASYELVGAQTGTEIGEPMVANLPRKAH